MSRQARLGTKPELVVRGLLHSQGLRYRVGHPVPGRPRRSIDIAFPGKRVAVFIDGCFWHGCPDHFVPPKNNARRWADKIEHNRQRDVETDELLRECGWGVLRFWEHESATSVAAAIRERVRPQPPK